MSNKPRQYSGYHRKSNAPSATQNAAITLLQSLTRGNQQLMVEVNGKRLAFPEAMALAERFKNTGEIEAADLIYRQLLEQATVWHRELRLDDAELLYRAVFEARPIYTDALHLLGVIYSQRGNHATAERLIRQAVNEKPGTDIYHNNLGRALQEQGRLEEAADCYRRTLEINPEHVLACNNLGKVHAQLGEWEEAISAFRRAVALRPDFQEAQRNLEQTLHASAAK